MSRIDTLKAAAARFDIDLTDESGTSPDYNMGLLEALDAGKADRWMAVIESDEYELRFGVLHRSKRAAMDDLAGTATDPYGKFPVALVDLQTGQVWDQLIVKVTTGSVTATL